MLLQPARGGAIVYRAGQYYPNLITHIFSICTPYFPPSPVYEPLHILVNKRLPNFGYQEHLASGELEEVLQSRSEIKSFLNGMYGARGPNGEFAFDAAKGIFLENLAKMEERIDRLTRRQVTAGHWAQWEKPEEVNGILKEWLDGVVFGGKSKL